MRTVNDQALPEKRPMPLTVAEVHGYFKTDTQVFVGWLSPHSCFLYLLLSRAYPDP